MTTILTRTLEEMKDLVQKNPEKHFKLTYVKDSNREVLTLWDKEDDVVYYFANYDPEDSNKVFREISNWRFSNLELIMDSVILTLPIINILSHSGFNFFKGRLFRTEPL